MQTEHTIALVGDYRPEVRAHVGIPIALGYANKRAGTKVEWEWIGTEKINDPATTLAGFGGIWVVPASPYKSMDGALAAVRYAREQDIPFLGTCGGFQHALIEFARDVAGLPGADHAETSSDATDLLVTQLSCSLVDKTGEITFTPGSQLRAIFGDRPWLEGFHCNYGLNPAYKTQLEAAGLRFTGFDANGEVRAAELPSNRFFIGTLFQPERSAFRGIVHPLILAFVQAVAGARSSARRLPSNGPQGSG